MGSKRTIYNIISSLILQFVVLLSGLIVPRLIINEFGSNVNGLISSITQFLSYIVLLELGIGPVVKAALYKPIANKNKQEIKNILKAAERFFRVIAGIFIIYLIGLAFVYPLLVKNEFSYVYTLSLVLIISISTFFEYYFGMTYTLYLHAEQRKYVTSNIQILGYILNIIVVVILINLNTSIHLVKLVSSLIFLCRPIIQNIYVKKKYNISLNDASNDYKLEKKWHGLAQHVAAIVHSSTDMIILTVLSTLSEVSVYSVYHLVEKGVKSFVTSFTSGIDAMFGNLIAKDMKKELNKSFDLYEFIYLMLISVIYICSIILIVPFVKVYTLGISDANYIRPLFGFLIILAGFISAIRLPYSSITLAAGHFKETQKGAWIEVIVNICLSIILVIRYGIVGVTVGTLISVFIRTIEFIYHSNKYILERNAWFTIKKVLLIILEFILVFVVIKLLPVFNIENYYDWLYYALTIFGISFIIVIGINYLFYKEQFKKIIYLLIRKLKGKGEK